MVNSKVMVYYNLKMEAFIKDNSRMERKTDLASLHSRKMEILSHIKDNLLKEKLVERAKLAIQMGIVIREVLRKIEEMDMESTGINKAISIMKASGAKIPEMVNLLKKRYLKV